MRSTRIHWLVAALLCLVVAGTTFAEEAKLETEDQRILYALGVMVASRMPKFDPTSEEIDMIMSGLKDGLQGKEPRVAMPDYIQKLDPYLQQRMAKASEAEMEAGTRFRDEVAKQAGAVKSDNGMIYIEIEAGSGAQPTAGDTVKVHYTGTLRDGTVFDSSIERGEPATFQVDAVVPCFAEGLQKMKVGGKAKLVCPPEQAYGNRGTPRIPPGASLAFEVELLEIVAAEPAG
jgi:FKBP-type peptidyl-prolyl cis-trans isomerase FkpA